MNVTVVTCPGCRREFIDGSPGLEAHRSECVWVPLQHRPTYEPTVVLAAHRGTPKPVMPPPGPNPGMPYRQ